MSTWLEALNAGDKDNCNRNCTVCVTFFVSTSGRFPPMEDTPVRNPRHEAGFLSLLTFSWINNVLRLGSKQPLEEKHLFTVETSLQAERLVADLEREWLAEERASEQNRTKPCLWRAMMRVIPCRDYVIVAFLRMLYAIAFNIFPLIVWFFLKSISTSSEISYEATLPFVIGISVVVFTITLWSNHGSFKAEIISTKLKVATIGLVYKKASAVHLFWNCSSKGMVILCTCLDNLVIFLNFWYPASKAKLKTRKTVSAKKCSECEEREREREPERGSTSFSCRGPHQVKSL